MTTSPTKNWWLNFAAALVIMGACAALAGMMTWVVFHFHRLFIIGLLYIAVAAFMASTAD